MRLSSLLLRLLEPPRLASVLAVTALGGRWRRVRLTTEALPSRPAPTVELELGPGLRRRYTPAWLDAVRGEFELVPFVHGEGPGTRWLSEVAAGDEVRFRWLERGLELNARHGPHVVCGDESCLGLAERLTAKGTAQLDVALESGHPLPSSAAAWLPRTGARGEAQWRWLARQSRFSSFYLAGHGPTVRRLAAKLNASGVPRARVHTVIHWAEGHPGL